MLANTIAPADHSPQSGQQNMPRADRGYINLPSRFDVLSSAQYRMPFSRLLGDPSKYRVVVDLSEVTYIDSSGIGTLIAWHKTCREYGKELVMENCGDKVMSIFKMLAVDRVFSVS